FSNIARHDFKSKKNLRRSGQPRPSSESYESDYDRWLRSPEEFWIQAAEDVHWYRKWDRVLDRSHAPLYRWFAGGIVNTCYNALDFHVENGLADQLALIHESPVTCTTRSYTYRTLLDEVARFAGVLREQGIKKHDRIII